MANNKDRKVSDPVSKTIIASLVILIIGLIVIVFIGLNNSVKPDKGAASSTETISETPTEPIDNIDTLMNDFQGTDEEVVKICSLELEALGVEHTTIEKQTIIHTEAGNFELEGFLSVSEEAQTTEPSEGQKILCTVFPGDEYPVEISFNKP